MKYMLDTNICIYIIKQRPKNVFNKFREYKPEDICISSITLAELEYGVAKSIYKERNKIALLGFLAPVSVLPFDDVAASKFGEIRANLEKEGQVIGGYDMLIAAHALAKELILVTNNADEFNRVEGITLENWIHE